MVLEPLTLTIGDKNLSSWSMRPWLALKAAGQPFTEVTIRLDRPDTNARLQRISPSGTVPCLHHGKLVIWDSLAICEYLAESFPAARLWPADAVARARARSIAAEMHSGFAALRANLRMELIARRPGQNRAAGVAENIARIAEIWRTCVGESGGPFLFGPFTIADAMYAPVVGRFATYGVDLEGSCRRYADAVMAWPAYREWLAGAQAEVAAAG